MVKRKGSARGFFSNYCGLGGSGPVLHKTDAICKQHDECYSELSKSDNPYLYYNDCDEEMMRALKRHKPETIQESVPHGVALDYFHTKKSIAPTISPNNRAKKRAKYEAPKASLSKLPAEATMSGTQVVGGTEDNGQKDGAEDAPNFTGHIWYGFPNEQSCVLRYLDTFYINDGGAVGLRTEYMQRPDTYATTDLTAGGGGVLNSSAYSSLVNSTFASGYDFDQPWLFQVKMTSPYAIINTPAGLLSGLSNVGQPNWIALWDQKYTYYHQHSVDFDIHFTFGTPTISGNTNAVDFQNYGLWCFYKYTEQDNPPTQWTNKNLQTVAHAAQFTENALNAGGGASAQADGATFQTTTAGGDHTFPLTSDDYMRMPHWHKKYISWNTISSTRATVSGTYMFGQCKMDTKTMNASVDNLGAANSTELWAKTGATPVFPENLSIILVEDCRRVLQTGIQVNVAITVDTRHKLTFKDLRQAYKFPTPNLTTALGVSTQYGDEINFSRGAAY